MASKRRYDDDYDYGEYGDSRSRRGSSSRYDDADSGYEDDDSYGRSSGRGYEDDRYEDGRGGYDDRYDDEYDSGYEDDDSYGRSSGRVYEDDRYEAGYDGRYDDGYRDDDYDDRYDDYEEERRPRGNRKKAGRSSASARSSAGGRKSSGRNDYYQEERITGSSRGGRSKPKKKHGKGRAVLLFVEIVALVVVLGVLYITNKATKAGKLSLNDEQITEQMNDNVVKETQDGSMKGYRNIALFGVDSRSNNLASGDNRSDTIMIASINEDTGDVKLVSVYRDTYLNTGNDDYTKCNAAYAKGGPEQAITMLNMNLDMNITDFITVGFAGLTKVVDDVGGVDIDVDDAELPHLNSYALTMSQELDYPYEELTQTGTVHLNGLQATAYCRIRYTAGDDFKRTERQREVLMAVLSNAKTLDAASLDQTASDLFDKDMIYTSFDLSDIVDMLGNISSDNITGQDGFPQEDLRTTGNVQIGGVGQSCVIPRDLSDNVVWLHHFLFDDQDYQVSSEVQEYSDKIASDTAGIG